MIKLGIRTKIIILSLIAGFVPFVITGILGYRTASLSLREQAFNQLVSVREAKKKQIEDYFSNIRKQIQTFSEDKMIIDAMKEFKDAFNEFQESNSMYASQLEEYRAVLRSYYTGDFTDEYKRRNDGRNPDAEDYFNQIDDESVALQYFYIKTNHNPLGEKHRLDFADDNSAYSRLHGYYHPIIRNYLEKFGYYDIFLVDPVSGGIVYSVFKELDFSTSLTDGPYAKTNLGRVFREVNDSNDPNYVKLVDYEPYPPSYEDAASFIASPIFDGTEKVGVLIFQMPIDKINMVMTSNNDWMNVGLGESGETYLIGDDFTMRNQSRFIIEDKENYFEQLKKIGANQGLLNIIKAKESTILLQKVKTKGTKAAISGETNIEIFPDYRNVLVLSAYAPLDIKDVRWAIMSEIDEEEALRPVIELANSVFEVAGITGILVILAVFLSVKITKPIKKLIEGTKKIAEGDLTFRIETKSKDEIGYLAASFNEMVSRLGESKKQLQDYAEHLEERVEEKTVEIRKISHAIEQSSSTILITDIKGNIEYTNPRFTQLTSYTSEEAIGKKPSILKSGKTPPEVYKELWKTIMSGNEWRGEFCNKKKNGELYWESASISPVKNDAGVITHFIAVKEDITERKQMEEKLEKRVEQRTSDIKQLLLQKDAFINQLSHDLKTPLTPLVALLPMVESRINNQETKRLLGLIMKNVDYMKILTERTLQLARLNSPSVRLNLERVDILSEIRDIIVNFLPVFEERGIKVVNNTTPPIIVEADRTLIKELLHNIISNAVNYSNGEGVVTFDNFSNSNNVEILISDNGVGIKMGQLRHVFEEFYKVDDSRHDRSSTGLGLAICKSIIERHGGAIWAESLGTGQGTTVHFTLPTIQGERQKNG